MLACQDSHFFTIKVEKQKQPSQFLISYLVISICSRLAESYLLIFPCTYHDMRQLIRGPILLVWENFMAINLTFKHKSVINLDYIYFDASQLGISVVYLA